MTFHDFQRIVRQMLSILLNLNAKVPQRKTRIQKIPKVCYNYFLKVHFVRIIWF